MARGIIRRGDFVLAAAPGDYGKPRPMLVVQSDLFAGLPSISVCPLRRLRSRSRISVLTSLLRNDAGLLRIAVDPDAANGLRKSSQIAIDKMTALPKTRFGEVIGRADDALMLQVTRALAVFLAIA